MAWARHPLGRTFAFSCLISPFFLLACLKFWVIFSTKLYVSGVWIGRGCKQALNTSLRPLYHLSGCGSKSGTWGLWVIWETNGCLRIPRASCTRRAASWINGKKAERVARLGLRLRAFSYFVAGTALQVSLPHGMVVGFKGWGECMLNSITAPAVNNRDSLSIRGCGIWEYRTGM